MMRKFFLIFIIILFNSCAFADNFCDCYLAKQAILFNALNLTDEQIECIRCINTEREFKKILTHQQRSKYSMIKKLQKTKDKYRQHNFYKKNKQMQTFGDPCYSYQNIK